MAIGSLTIVDRNDGSNNTDLILQAVLSGSYPGGGAGGGETLDLSGQAVPIGNPYGIDWEGFFENPGAANQPVATIRNVQLNGYDAIIVPGSNLTNWKLLIVQTAATYLGNVTYASVGIAAGPPQMNLITFSIIRRKM